MGNAPSRRHWPRYWRLQFSLASVFVLITLAAIGAWYWFQLPFAVVQTVSDLDPVCPVGMDLSKPRPQFKEIFYVRRVWGGETIRHGSYHAFDSQGKLVRTGNFRNGDEHGLFVGYYPAGQKAFERRYLNGSAEGLLQRWFVSGNLAVVQAYENGKQSGLTRLFNADGSLLQEENLKDNVLHGPFDHRTQAGERLVEGAYERGLPSGKWTWYPSARAGGRITGYWSAGVAVGSWRWHDTNGEPYLTADFDNGRAIAIEPSELSPRILERLIGSTDHYFPGHLAEAFKPIPAVGETPSLAELATQVSHTLFCFEGADMNRMKTALVPLDERIDLERGDEPLLMTFARILKRHGLGFDYRYGAIVIDTLASIARWRDATGVTRITPERGSRLETGWDRAIAVDFVETPLSDLLAYFADISGIVLDASQIPATNVGDKIATALDSCITTSVKGLRFKDALGRLLGELRCKASLRGDAIVIEPQ